jgi:hypothetical protein
MAIFQTQKRFLILSLLGLLLSLSCGRIGPFAMSNYKKAVKSGFKQIPEAMQLETLFGDADHFISYSGSSLPRDWNSEVSFDGRYTLTMQVEVKTNDALSEITEVVDKPKFVLVEASKVILHSNGTTEVNYSGDWKFGLDDWKKVFETKGDFSVIGIKLKQNQPVKDFEGYVNAVRSVRIRVRPD